MFWFYSHPAVYIMILPAMGVVSELIPCYARRPIFGYAGMVYALMSIAILSFFVWAHHMFTAGISIYSALIFSLMTFLVAVPSAIKVFNWTISLHKGQIHFDAPMLYALGFVLLFTTGGVTGLIIATLAVDVHMQDTYFIVAHFHYIMVGGTVSAFFGGVHFWWPKMTGRLYPEIWARFTAILTYIGFNLTFMPQFILGYLGMPRRYYAYPPEWQSWNLLSSAGASILAVAYVLPLFYLGWSIFYGRRAGANPCRPPGSNGRPRRRRQSTISSARPVVTTAPYQYEPEDDSFTTQDGTNMPSRTLQPEIQYATLEQQSETAQLGIWLFLMTETLFFGALLLGYTVLRHAYPGGFAEAGKETKIVIGTVNSAVLLTSSLTMVLGDQCRRQDRHARAAWPPARGDRRARHRVPCVKGVEY